MKSKTGRTYNTFGDFCQKRVSILLRDAPSRSLAVTGLIEKLTVDWWMNNCDQNISELHVHHSVEHLPSQFGVISSRRSPAILHQPCPKANAGQPQSGPAATTAQSRTVGVQNLDHPFTFNLISASHTRLRPAYISHSDIFFNLFFESDSFAIGSWVVVHVVLLWMSPAPLFEHPRTHRFIQFLRLPDYHSPKKHRPRKSPTLKGK